MADQAIELTDYDPVWSDRFAEQQARLTDLLKPWLAGEIEHIGSTSVPGLRSKPVVDLLAPVQSLAAARAAILMLELDGWLLGRTILIVTIVFGFCGRTRQHEPIIFKSSRSITPVLWHSLPFAMHCGTILSFETRTPF